jgi:hypothetical protein
MRRWFRMTSGALNYATARLAALAARAFAKFANKAALRFGDAVHFTSLHFAGIRPLPSHLPHATLFLCSLRVAVISAACPEPLHRGQTAVLVGVVAVVVISCRPR